MIETFNAKEWVTKVGTECLNIHWFESLEEAQKTLELWRRDYNEERPHRALNGHTPYEYLKSLKSKKQAQT